MPERLTLLFGVHNHQPVGNFPEVFHLATQHCYRPFISTLKQFPQIKCTLHFSGSLIDWLLKDDPGLLEIIRQLLRAGQIELLTGGYFEPVLTMIPENDRIGQIEMLSDFIKEYFGYQPQGMWLGERVWDGQLINSLVVSGVKYILLDDYHFLRAGLRESDLNGHYTVKDSGSRLNVLPISNELRYLVPFSRPQQPINYLRSQARKGQAQALTIVDDGEKFGFWPGTHRWVYGRKWLNDFFQLLIDNQDWLETKTIGGYLRSHSAKAEIQLPPASYQEMMQWSEGSFDNFFKKYPEADRLRKRMLYVSKKVAEQKEQVPEAKRYLFMSQSNCPYWHGVFGGVYLAHLRHQAYQNLLRAESSLEEKKGPLGLTSEFLDFNQQGEGELAVKNPLLNLFVNAAQGGAIYELDYRPQAVNLLDGLSRRPEAYHQLITNRRGLRPRIKRPVDIHNLLGSKEPDLNNLLIYDNYNRASLLDHFLPQQLQLPDFKNLHYTELGDFINGRYALRQKRENKRLILILERTGQLDYQDQRVPLALTKQLSVSDQQAKIEISYNLENLGLITPEVLFGIEFNLALGQPLNKEIVLADSRDISFPDPVNRLRVLLDFDLQTNFWAFPLQTVSCSESGFERNYQQTVILAFWPIRLEKTFHFCCNLNILRL